MNLQPPDTHTPVTAGKTGDDNLDSAFDQVDSNVMIVPFKGFYSKGTEYAGVEVRVFGDSRDLNKDLHKLELVGGKPSNTVKLTMPRLLRPFWADLTKLQAQMMVPSAKQGEQDCFYVANKKMQTAYRKLDDKEKVKTITLTFPDDWQLTDAPFIKEGDSKDLLEIVSVSTACFAKTGEFQRNADGSKELDDDNKEVPIVNMVNTQAWRLVNIQKKEDVDFNRRKSGGGIAAALAKGASMDDDDDDD